MSNVSVVVKKDKALPLTLIMAKSLRTFLSNMRSDLMLDRNVSNQPPNMLRDHFLYPESIVLSPDACFAIRIY